MIKLSQLSMCVVLTIATLLCTVSGQAPEQPGGQQERKLIAVLESDAPPGEKALACKNLAIYGTKEAVPSLARLLSDPELASWSRIALEAIPDEACDVALRQAVGRLNGTLLIGAINSLAVRRDAGAVNVLTAKLKDPDAEVVAATAAALGRIGNSAAAGVLAAALANAAPRDRAAIAHGCVLCAERLLDDGKSREASLLYDAAGKADVPVQTILEATRGSILSRGPAGVPLLIEQLHSPDRNRFGIALRTARELAGQQVTEALAAELAKMSPDRRRLLLLAISDRIDPAVLPIVVKAAGPENPVQLRITAVGVLENIGDVSCVPVLLQAAADDDAALAARARNSLTRLAGDTVDQDLLARFPAAKGGIRRALIAVAGERQIHAALPAIVQSTQDPDPTVRAAAYDAVSILGGAAETSALVRLLMQAQTADERNRINRALGSITGRAGAAAAADLLPLMKSDDSALRIAGLGVLGIAGGQAALDAVVLATQDKQDAVQDQAVRTLSNWPYRWPNDAGAAAPLLHLATKGTKESHRVLGMRGYLQYIRVDANLPAAEKLSRVRELLPLIDRTEEKRLAVAVLGQIPAADSVKMLTTLAEDAAVGEESRLALANLVAAEIDGVSLEQRRRILEMVVEKAATDATRRKAADALKRIR